jgi:hypothetical protein
MRCYELDHSTRFSFYASLSIYLRVAGYVCTGSTILALIAAYLHLPDAAGWLAAAAITSLLFTVWISWCYEMYLHSKYPLNKPTPPPAGVPTTYEERERMTYVGPSNYTTAHYAVTEVLAVLALFSFIVGLIMLVAEFAVKGGR